MAGHARSAEKLCELGRVTTLLGEEDVRKCANGDVVDAYVDPRIVSPAALAARICDFSGAIVIDPLSRDGTVHVACVKKLRDAPGSD